MGPASRHRHRVWGKDAEARGLFGKAQKDSVLPLCLPCAEMAAHWGSLAMGWAIAKLPNGIVGLAVSCCGPFWGDLQLQPHSQDASAFQSSSGGREQPGEGTLLGR